MIHTGTAQPLNPLWKHMGKINENGSKLEGNINSVCVSYKS